MPDSCKTISECDKIINPWRNKTNIDGRRSLLPLGLLLSHPTYFLHQPRQILQIVDCCMPDSLDSRAALLPRLCSPVKVYLLPLLARAQGTASHRVGPVSLTSQGIGEHFSPGRSDQNLSPAPTAKQS